jgi:glutathione S-transferase
MITLYQYEISPFCDKVRRAMHLKGLAYQTVEVLPSKRNAHKAISPTGKFPAITHNGKTIVDSSDILRYLDELSPSPKLAPDAPRDAAIATILEDWADESLYFYDLTMRNWPHNRAWFIDDLLRYETGLTKSILAKVIPSALGKIAQTQGLGRKSQAVVTADMTMLYRALSDLLGEAEWLCGPRLSGGDLSVFVMLFVLNRTKEGAATLESLPNLKAWYTRVDAATAKPAA